MIAFSLHQSVRVFCQCCVAGAVLGIIYNLFAAVLVFRFQRERQGQATTTPSVTILKPLHGSEPGLFRRLAVLCNQDYVQKIQLVCGTQAAADPALHVVALLKRRYPKTQIDVVVDEHSRGTNRKISNLVNMEPLARHELIILSDSDILVDEQFISRVAAEMEQPGPGALSCAYYGLAAGGIWAKAAATNINCQFLPNVIVALTFGATKPCFGAVIAMPKATLNSIGGLTPFLEELADDHAIGRELRSAGIEVRIPRFAVGHVCFERNLGSFWQHHMRVARTIRSIDPLGYVGTIFMHPMMLSLLAACFSAEHSVGLTIGALASRAFLGSSVEHSFGLPRQPPWILALHDAISFAVFLSSFFGTSVAWRGYSYRILRDGTLEEEN